MSRGLSKQQKNILAVLRTKQDPRDSNKGAFTTDEVISELSWDYKMWLASDGPFGTGPRARHALRPYEKLRVSIHRALQNLESRGLIVSYVLRGSRWWGILDRLSELERKWVTYSAEERKRRRILWQWGWWLRHLPLELGLAYRFGIATPEQIEELKRRADEWERTHLSRR